MNPAVTGEARSPQVGAREASLGAALRFQPKAIVVPPPPRAVIAARWFKDFAETPRRGDFDRVNIALEQRARVAYPPCRGNCHAFTAKGSPDFHGETMLHCTNPNKKIHRGANGTRWILSCFY
jgi:hypothetical protein